MVISIIAKFNGIKTHLMIFFLKMIQLYNSICVFLLTNRQINGRENDSSLAKVITIAWEFNHPDKSNHLLCLYVFEYGLSSRTVLVILSQLKSN